MALYTDLDIYTMSPNDNYMIVQIDDKKMVLELARIPFIIYTSFIVSYISVYKDKVPKHLKYIV